MWTFDGYGTFTFDTVAQTWDGDSPLYSASGNVQFLLLGVG